MSKRKSTRSPGPVRRGEEGKKTLSMRRGTVNSAQEPAGSPALEAEAAFREEMAEDMLDLIKRVNAIDAKLTELTGAVERIIAFMETESASRDRETAKLKESLISDRKEIVGRSTLNALIPAIDSLRFLEETHKGRKRQSSLLKQTHHLLDVLTGITHTLGYRAQEASPGEAFDPWTMECVGYDRGEPGRVVRVDRPGYRAGKILVRPCRVVLGKQPGGLPETDT